LLQIAANAIQHLEFKPVARNVLACGESLRLANDVFIVRGQPMIDAALQQDLHQLDIISVDFRLFLEGNFGRFLVGTLAQPNADAVGQQLFNVAFGAVHVSLDHCSHTALVPGYAVQLVDKVERALRVGGAFHIHANEVPGQHVGGFDNQAGDQFVVVADRDKARGISEYREQKAREAQLAKSSRVSLEGLAEQMATAGMKELNVILKADVQGSVEVLSDLLSKLSNDKVRLKVLHSGVGAITETDVLLASASNAIIIGFSVRPERKAQELAEQEKVDIRLHSIIYELQDEIKRAMSGLLEPTIKETYQGRAEVRETFRIPKVGTVAGCQVTDGIIKRDSEVRLLRDNVVIFKGKVGSLRRFKDDASEVRNGMECGISIANYGDIKVGDVIEAFATERIAAEVIA